MGSGSNGSGGKAAVDLASAQRLVQSGDYSTAIPRLQAIINQYPQTSAGIEARYFLGIAYEEVGGTTDAIKYFAECIQLSPNGPHVTEARQRLARLGNNLPAAPLSGEAFSKHVKELQDRVNAEPDKSAAAMELADFFWSNGKYKEAGDLYTEILKRWPECANDKTLQSRAQRQDDGTYVVLTPEEAARRYAELDPLLLFNTTSFRSGRPSGWSGELKHNTYNVSGQVKNRSSKTISNVQIAVTIYGFTGMVYDTQIVNVGALQPGQVRAFSVRFSNFDDIENVHHYECIGSYER